MSKPPPLLRLVVCSAAAVAFPLGPGLVYLGLGAIALVAVPSLFGVPVESIRFFYPDVRWGLTAIGVLAILWGLARTALALRSIVSAA